MPDFQTTPEASVVAQLAKTAVDPKTVNVAHPLGDQGEGAQIIFAPMGTQPISVKKYLDEYRDRPERRAGTAQLEELNSFIAHVNRFKDEDSVLFATKESEDEETPELLAVLDYHEQTAEGLPRFGKHRSHYGFTLSEEWEAWTGKNRQPLGQGEFAEFIEEHLLDVVDPSKAFDSTKAQIEPLGVALAGAAKLVELSKGLQLHVKSAVRNRVNLQSGELELAYAVDHEDMHGQPLKVPGAFLVGIAVFRGGVKYQLPVRLRYRESGGKVSWWFDLLNHDAAFDVAFSEACKRAQKETALPLFYGSPEES